MGVAQCLRRRTAALRGAAPHTKTAEADRSRKPVHPAWVSRGLAHVVRHQRVHPVGALSRGNRGVAALGSTQVAHRANGVKYA